MHDGATRGFCKVGTDEEGAFFNRVEHAAACITLEDALRHAGSHRPLILLTDSKYLLMAIPDWIGQDIDPNIKASPDENILREILELLRERIELGFFTLFVKITRRKECCNEMSNGWADNGRDTEMEARWTSLRQRPIFTWTAPGKTHRSTMSKVVKTQAHLIAARLQISEHDNFIAQFWRERATVGWVLAITGKTKEAVWEPSATFSRLLASNFRVLRIQVSRYGVGERRMNADCARPSTRNCTLCKNA